MFSKPLFVTLSVLMPLALGVALNPPAGIEPHLIRKSPSYLNATIYDGPLCLGNILYDSDDFGCDLDGCITFPGGAIAASIFLRRQHTYPGSDYPTASLFSDSNCQNKIASAGVNTDEHGSCTPEFGPSGELELWNFSSVRLYYGC